MTGITSSTLSSAEEPLAELFHHVDNLIPQGQHVETATRKTTVAQAIALMYKKHFSQLPVVSGSEVLGVFSYRSLALNLLKNATRVKDISDLPVEEFMERYQFIQPKQNWENILPYLDDDDGVIVGSGNSIQGIITAIDVLHYLHEIARPFVILAEIETTLRQLIRVCVDDEEFNIYARECLSKRYKEEEFPSSLENLEFSDYIQIICNGNNWTHFTEVFGTTEYQRKETNIRLNKVRELRNVVFHFRQPLQPSDLDELTQQREWLEMKSRAFRGQKNTLPV